MLDRYNFQVHTFGCKVNTYDSGLLEKELLQAGLKSDINGTNPGIHILNTCAVTAEATKEATRRIRQIKSKEPFSTVVVTGCAAQVDTGVFEKLSGADLIVANSHKSEMSKILDKYFAGTLKERTFKSNIFRKEDLGLGGGIESSHTRSFLKIQDGCNSFCTYCVIPFGRGKSRSVPVGEIIARVKKIEQMGLKEVVLTGVHIADYEDFYLGKKVGLDQLVEEVLLRTSIPRIRLTSLEPKEVSEQLLSLYVDPRFVNSDGEGRLCPHFHMSIQSATDSTLKGMKRRYNSQDVRDSLNMINKKIPGVFIGMDVIVGFPGETEEDFVHTMRVLEETPWSKIHVFPYSERPGTKAENMENKVPGHEIKRRAKLMRELSSMRYNQQAMQQIGTKKKILLLDKEKDDWNYGLSRDFWSVKLKKQTVESFLISSNRPEVDVEIIGFAANTKRINSELEGRVV